MIQALLDAYKRSELIVDVEMYNCFTSNEYAAIFAFEITDLQEIYAYEALSETIVPTVDNSFISDDYFDIMEYIDGKLQTMGYAG